MQLAIGKDIEHSRSLKSLNPPALTQFPVPSRLGIIDFSLCTFLNKDRTCKIVRGSAPKTLTN